MVCCFAHAEVIFSGEKGYQKKRGRQRCGEGDSFVGRLPVIELPISRCIIIKHGAAGSTSLDKDACKILDRGDAG
jgi:hypothetical protein